MFHVEQLWVPGLGWICELFGCVRVGILSLLIHSTPYSPSLFILAMADRADRAPTAEFGRVFKGGGVGAWAGRGRWLMGLRGLRTTAV